MVEPTETQLFIVSYKCFGQAYLIAHAPLQPYFSF